MEINILDIYDFKGEFQEEPNGPTSEIELLRFDRESKIKLHQIMGKGIMSPYNRKIHIPYIQIVQNNFSGFNARKYYSGLFIPVHPQADPEFDAFIVSKFMLFYKDYHVFDDCIEIYNLGLIINSF